MDLPLNAADNSWSRSSRWRALVFLTFIVPGLLGAGAVVLLNQRYGFDPVLKIALGLVMLLLGLNTLFWLAAFDSTTTTRSRVRDSLRGCAMVLLGAAQLTTNRYVMFGMGVTGLVLAVATVTGRPRRLLGLGQRGAANRTT